MTPTETAAILRQFNNWCRDPSDFPASPMLIEKAIDAAIAMIDRLEGAESDALEQARLNGMGASREAALLAKLEAAEKERDALRAELDNIKQVEFQRRVEKVAEGWRGKCDRLEKERAELLEALKSIEDYWNQDQNETAMADACWHAINTARAAIARATGEQP